jgi:hypothetical protein
MLNVFEVPEAADDVLVTRASFGSGTRSEGKFLSSFDSGGNASADGVSPVLSDPALSVGAPPSDPLSFPAEAVLLELLELPELAFWLSPTVTTMFVLPSCAVANA